MTRDRLYQEIEWEGVTITIMDMGGIGQESGDPLAKLVSDTAKEAVAEADVVIFLVDGMGGITRSDRELAIILRKEGERVIVAVNKIDNARQEDLIDQFYEFGYPDVIGISAIHGRNVGQLLDLAVEQLKSPLRVEQATADEISIAIMGKQNVGKSMLLNRLLGSERALVSEMAGTTRDSVYGNFQWGGRRFVIADTAGLKRESRARDDIEFYSFRRAIKALKSADVSILLIDAVSGITLDDKRIARAIEKAGKGIVIGINKWDLFENSEENRRRYRDYVYQQFAKLKFACAIFTSGLTGIGITGTEKGDHTSSTDSGRIEAGVTMGAEEQMRPNLKAESLLGAVIEAYDNYRKKVPQESLREIIQEAVLIVTPPPSKGQQLDIKDVVQVRAEPPTFRFLVNRAELVRLSYRNYLEGVIRKHFGFKGTTIVLNFQSRIRRPKR